MPCCVEYCCLKPVYPQLKPNLRNTYRGGPDEGLVSGWRWFLHCRLMWWEEGWWRGSWRWRSYKRLDATIVENCSVLHIERNLLSVQSYLLSGASWRYITVWEKKKKLENGVTFFQTVFAFFLESFLLLCSIGLWTCWPKQWLSSLIVSFWLFIEKL